MRLSILGATGSIGTTALTLLGHEPGRFTLEAVTAMENADALIALAKKYRPKFAAIGNPAHGQKLKDALAGTGIETGAGEEAIIEAAKRPAEIVLSAIVGAAGLKPTLAAIRRGARVALANKECLVCAGELMLGEIQKHKAQLLPVDSEHNAIYQVFDFARPETVSGIILTASGGPFRTMDAEQMQHVTVREALAHPNWKMGEKITVDSATMMNKGLELIEAYYLFPVKKEQIEILVHPESIIHSMVRYRDGSVLAQLGNPDMATPIAYALSWPERMAAPVKPLDLAKIGALHFEKPDEKRFPSLRLAREALQKGGSAPIILNAANELAVKAFLAGKLGFTGIAGTVERMLEHYPHHAVASLEDVFATDAAARRKTGEIIGIYG